MTGNDAVALWLEVHGDYDWHPAKEIPALAWIGDP
jgi:hypothetical protein